MAQVRILPLAQLLACALLVACGADQVGKDDQNGDPAIESALEEQLLIDPDLIDQNLAGSAIDVPLPDRSLPQPELGDRALSAAREAAFGELGGSESIVPAPAPVANSEGYRAAAAVPRACMGNVGFSARWAAQMPPAMPVFPLGAVQQAAGSDHHGCSLRLARFITPVPVAEVLDYYHTRARLAEMSGTHAQADGTDILWGARQSARYVLYVRPYADGGSEVDLLTIGF
jgi:hypothetical protein